jgi:hypothetical protein
MEVKYLGEEFKTKVWITSEMDFDLDEFDWEARLWCSTKKEVVIKKEQAIPLGGGVYVLRVDTTETGAGTLKLKVIAQVPDGDFNDGFRTAIDAMTICQILNNYAG